MKKILIALAALSALAVCGTAFAQLPDGTTPNPHAASSNASAEEAAVGEQIRGAGFTRPSNLHRNIDGTWRGRAFKGNTEVAVAVDQGGHVSYRY